MIQMNYYFITKTLDKLVKTTGSTATKKINTDMLYVSDHGESLGEHGLYLHGFPYSIASSEQTHISMLF